MPDIEREHKAINDFCMRNTLLTGLDTKVIEWPDEENPGRGYGEAIVLRGSKKAMLDHTRIQSFKDHFKDDSLLESIVSPLQDTLKGLYPNHCIKINLQVRGLPKGNRDKMRKHLREECIKVLPSVPDDHKDHIYRFVSVPCTVWIRKKNSHRPCCLVGRVLPENQTNELYDAMLKTLLSKSKQFKRFKEMGFNNTILLMETEDFTSIDEFTIPSVFSLAKQKRDLSAIDDIYLLFRYPHDDFLILPLKIAERTYPDLDDIYEHFEIQSTMV